MNEKPSIIVLISGNGSNLQAIIDYSLRDDSHYSIAAVISNRADAYGLNRALDSHIPTHFVDHRAFDSREQFDQNLVDIIEQYQPKMVVLAGFMRILSSVFVDAFANKLLNIHPSLLPKYQGLDTHQRALDAGDSEHGVSVHFVTEELDGGPVIMQSKVSIEAGDDAQSLQQKIHKREHLIYPLCVDWFCQDKVRAQSDKVFLDGELLAQPIIYEDIE